jgi:glycosyltransferase involved in cell wall biosynthesis
MMKPAILFDARLILHKPTGIGQYIRGLFPQLVHLAPDWHFHLLHSPQPWPGYRVETWTAPNVTHHLSTIPHMSVRQQLELPRLARRLGVALLHYPHFDAPVWWQPVPVVATIYDAKYLVRPDFFTNLSHLKRLYMRFCFAQTLRKAAAVLTISHYTAHDLLKLFKAPAGKLQVTPLAADIQFQPASVKAQQVVRAQYQLSRPFIVCVGELRPHKNQVGLIRAYAQCQSRATHDLVLIGQKYQDYAEPTALIRALNLSNQVHVLTDVTFEELIAFYSAADLFVLVSFYEGFGLPVLEAMACGAPVIASKTTAIGEVTGSGGLQVDPDQPTAIASAIDQVLLDSSYRQRLIAQGQQWHRQFTWQQTAYQTLGVYQQHLGARL